MARMLKPCGTRAAYVRHLSYGQAPCEPCTRANRAYEASRHGSESSPGEAQIRLNRDIREVVHVLACALGVGRQQ